MLSIFLALAVQTSSTNLPPAQALPPPVADERAVLAPIDEAFRALQSQDASALLRLVYPQGRVTAVGTLASGASGIRSESWAEYAARMKPGNGFKERISNPAIEIDGDIALVWAPFTIEVGGSIVACGTDHFDLVRQAGVWKIMNITFSSRRTGCPGR